MTSYLGLYIKHEVEISVADCVLTVQSHPIEALSPALCPPARLGLQDSSLSTPLVYVASGPHEVGLWDVEQGKCHQVRPCDQHW